MENDNELLPHQQRVVDEKRELDQKIKDLQKFIEGEGTVYMSLSNAERIDLTEQYHNMLNYSEILFRRINRF